MQQYPSMWLTYNNKRQLLAIIFLLIRTTAKMIVQMLCYINTGVLENWKKWEDSRIFYLTGIYYMQGWTATTWGGVTRKRNTKRLRQTGNLFRKNLQLKDVC